MSVINLKGNIVANTGKHLPAPYIDKITLFGGTDQAKFRSKTSVFTVNHIDRWIYKNTDVMADETAYALSMKKELNYYVMVFVGASGTSDVDESTGVSYYESVLNGVNPFVMYYDSGSVHEGEAPILLTQIYPFDHSPESGFNEHGQNILKFSAARPEHGAITYDIKEIFPEIAGLFSTSSYGRLWDLVDSLKIITFSSTYDYFNNITTFEEKKENIPLLQLSTSELSYENIIENGALSPAGQTIYLNSSEEVYQEIPLVSIDLVPYQVGKITHEQVVDKFQDLLDNYQSYYETEDKYHKLKNIMDNVSVVLATHAESENILPQLNQIAKTYPDKAPIKPIGKFYKSFRKRLFAVNRAIKSGTQLRRKILYSSKVEDARDLPEFTTEKIIHDARFDVTEGDSTSDKYIYENWSYSSVPGSWGNSDVVFGHYFFDYEKALRRVSNLSKVFRVGKLIDVFGLHVPYTTFSATHSWVYRLRMPAEESYYALNEVTIGTTMTSNRPYPRSQTTQIRDYAHDDEPGVIFSPDGKSDKYFSDASVVQTIFEATPYSEMDPDAETQHLGPSQGYATSLVYREFLDLADPAYDSTRSALQVSSIENYRLMCFELLDYRHQLPVVDTSFSGGAYSSAGTGYHCYVTVDDDTKKIVNTLTASCRSGLGTVQSYFDAAQEACAYNENAEEFNKYFRDAIISEYGDNIDEAPWLRGPLAYIMHLDLIFDTFSGDRAKIIAAATEISQQISPINGSLANLEKFKNSFEEFVNDQYGESAGASSRVGDAVADMMDTQPLVFRAQLSPDGIVPSYVAGIDAILEVADQTAAFSEADSDTLEASPVAQRYIDETQLKVTDYGPGEDKADPGDLIVPF